jgi:hypothetical protein
LFPQAIRYLVSPIFIEIVVTDIRRVADAERVARFGISEGTTYMEVGIRRKCRRGPRPVDFYAIVTVEASIGREPSIACSKVEDARHARAIFVSDFPNKVHNTMRCLNL